MKIKVFMLLAIVLLCLSCNSNIRSFDDLLKKDFTQNQLKKKIISSLFLMKDVVDVLHMLKNFIHLIKTGIISSLFSPILSQ